MKQPTIPRIGFAAAFALVVFGCASEPRSPIDHDQPPTPQAAHVRTASEIAAAVEPSVVTIYSYSDNELVGTGTGFFIREDGVIVSNAHVVVDGDTLKIELADGEVFDDVYVLSVDDQRDLILLQIATSRAPALKVDDDRDLRIGDPIYVVGNPLGFRGTFSDGIVSGKRLEGGVNYLQITAPISHGSSGGPVLNKEGRVVGVATAYMEGGQNMNIAVPARHAIGMMSMASDPMLFSELMAEIRRESESGRSTSRADETAELLDAVPASIRSNLDSLSVYEKQTMIRVFAMGSLLGEGGYSYVDDAYITGALASGAVDSGEFFLQPGDYIAVGSCDDDCVDMDVVIFNGNLDELGADRDADAEAIADFNITRPTKVILGSYMVDCSTANCIFYVGLFKKSQ